MQNEVVMIDVVLRKGNVKYSFRYNGFIHCVVIETGFASHTYQISKENGNELYKKLIADGYERG